MEWPGRLSALTDPEPTATSALEILYRDECLVAINKPAGLLVHRSAIDRQETRFALQMLRDQIGQRVYPIHRLDKPTSGILVFGLAPQYASSVARQFEQRMVDKHYLAVVRGYCPEEGTVNHPLRDKHDDADRSRRPAPEAREAVTRYRRLATVELPYQVDRYLTSRYSLVSLTPATGRRHQLRRHMKHIGHPIIGDAKHGKGVHNRFFKLRFGCGRLLLAATALAFVHPLSEERLSLSASPGQDFRRLMHTLGWETDDV